MNEWIQQYNSIIAIAMYVLYIRIGIQIGNRTLVLTLYLTGMSDV
jgi:hypothetical protein